ncbi:MAG TPA: efflux transporter outer membrane subunit [Methylocystis sp.]|nr:efflux transporter outer membrane subunit [Methylocystis sp.]
MTQARDIVAAAVLALSLAGCVPGDEQRAEFVAPPAMERTLSGAGARQAGAWPVADWWRQFRSAGLDRAMAAALAQNQDLKHAYDRLHQAEAITEVEGSKLLPFVTGDMGMGQHRVPSHGVEASYNPDIAGQEKTKAYLNPMSFYYEFDFWGKNRAALNAALGETAAEAAELAEAQLALTTAIARTYFRGLSAARQLELAREMSKLRREALSVAETRFRTGLDIEDATAAARIDLEAALKREAGVEASLGLQQDLLARLTGQGPDAGRGLMVKGRVDLPPAPPPPKALPIELLAHRPDLAAAMHRAEAAAERIHVAKAEFLPSIDLAITAGLEASQHSTHIDKLATYLFRASAFNYFVQPGFHLPVFEGGRLRGRLEARRSEYDEAVDGYNETLLRAAQQVADSLVNIRQAGSLLEAQKRLAAATRQKLALARNRWNSGLKDRREILALAHDAFEAAYLQRSLEADLLSARVDLIGALGGGYALGPDPLAAPPTPEDDGLSPYVNFVESLGGG